MQARRKLDAVGIKIGRAQWQQLGRGSRLMICHAPANSDDEIAVLKLFVEEVTIAASGRGPAELPDEMRREATPPASPPPRLVERARELGRSLAQEDWDRLDQDERYALIKLGGRAKPSHNLEAALAEFMVPARRA
jgi:hypothetical protein